MILFYLFLFNQYFNHFIINYQVQPDQEGLTANMEEQAEDRESTKSDVKLGRLQFRIDYDFNQSNVSES